jgi:hypothetical protein
LNVAGKFEDLTAEWNVRRLKIFGERNTGTNALAELIKKNIGEILCPGVAREVVADLLARLAWIAGFDEPYRLFLRHAIVDDIFSVQPDECIFKHTIPEFRPRFIEQEVGIIFLVKNPYSWLVSMFRRPYGMLLPKVDEFSIFLRRPWLTVGRDNLPRVLTSPIEMWNRKVAAYCRFGTAAAQHGLPFCVLRFEDFVHDQLAVLRTIRTVFGFPGELAVPIVSSTKDPGLDLQYYRVYYASEAWRRAFSSADLAFCLTAIDWELAASFDYEKIEPSGSKAANNAVPGRISVRGGGTNRTASFPVPRSGSGNPPNQFGDLSSRGDLPLSTRI